MIKADSSSVTFCHSRDCLSCFSLAINSPWNLFLVWCLDSRHEPTWRVHLDRHRSSAPSASPCPIGSDWGGCVLSWRISKTRDNRKLKQLEIVIENKIQQQVCSRPQTPTLTWNVASNFNFSLGFFFSPQPNIDLATGSFWEKNVSQTKWYV